MIKAVLMPQYGATMSTGTIIKWLKQEGDEVKKGELLLEVMTDKAVMEVESFEEGILKKILAQEGDEVPVSEVIAYIGDAKDTVPEIVPEEVSGKTAAMPALEVEEKSAQPVQQAKQGRLLATPLARKLAEENRIDLATMQGTEVGGRIGKADVLRAIEEREKLTDSSIDTELEPKERASTQETEGLITKQKVHSLAENQAFSRKEDGLSTTTITDQEFEWVDLTPVQRITGQRMAQSAQTAPQFALTLTVDMTNALRFRQAHLARIEATTGEHLTITAILVKVVAIALRQLPGVNISFEGNRLKLLKSINVGIAVGTPDGLVVPVIRNADSKTLVQITQELTKFQEKARQLRFASEDLSGGTFTISNLGMYGIEQFHAIINPPESAILAVGNIRKVPVGLPDDTIALRPLMILTLSVDHRALDGVLGAQFMSKIKDLLEQPYLIVE